MASKIGHRLLSFRILSQKAVNTPKVHFLSRLTVSRNFWAKSHNLNFAHEVCHKITTKRSNRRPVLLASTGILTGFLSFLEWEDDLMKNEDPLIAIIKKGIYCVQKEDYNKAELIFHAALSAAREKSDSRAELYIFCCLGNNAFLKGEYTKSEALYKDVIKKLISQGMDENHEAIIEISLKLATIFSKIGRKEQAETGFTHCLRAQEKRIKEINLEKPLDKNEQNSAALYGLALDWYGKHLLRHQRYREALDYTKRAHEICVKVSGESAYQSMVLLSDIGCIYNLLTYWDEAIECFEKASKIGRELNSDQLKVIFYNLGMTYLMKKKWDLALRSCSSSYSMSEKDGDKHFMKLAIACTQRAQSQES